MSDHPGKDVDFHKRVLNEYKEGKAYRLFDSGWLKEISYQKITGLWMTMREGSSNVCRGDTVHSKMAVIGGEQGKRRPFWRFLGL